MLLPSDTLSPNQYQSDLSDNQEVSFPAMEIRRMVGEEEMLITGVIKYTL